MTEDQLKALMGAAAAPIRIILLSLFLVLGKLGWFTWLTPENAHETVNAVMDALIVLVPAGYAVWALITGFLAKLREIRENKPQAIIEKAVALPQVDTVLVNDPLLANSIPDPNVKTAPDSFYR